MCDDNLTGESLRFKLKFIKKPLQKYSKPPQLSRICKVLNFK